MVCSDILPYLSKSVHLDFVKNITHHFHVKMGHCYIIATLIYCYMHLAPPSVLILHVKHIAFHSLQLHCILSLVHSRLSNIRMKTQRKSTRWILLSMSQIHLNQQF